MCTTPRLFIGTLLACACLALSACRQSPAGQEGAAETPPGAVPLPPAEDLLFEDASELPPALRFEGDFLQGARWQGRDAVYWAVISKYEQGTVGTAGWASRLNIYLYEMRGGQLAGMTSVEAAAPKLNSRARLEAGKSRLEDFSSIGKALSFVYTICPDGGGACAIYASVLNRAGKYDFQVQSDIAPEVYLENQAVMMQGIPADVRPHLLEQLFPGR